MVPPTFLMSLLANANNKFRSVVLIGIILPILIGCSSSGQTIKKDIVGTWKFDQAMPQVDAIAKFNSDGTYSFSFVGDKTNDQMYGTYKLQGDTMEMHQTKAVRNGTETGQPSNWNGTVSWHDNDHIKMIHDGDMADATYTRKN
jgi:hypothetical protein